MDFTFGSLGFDCKTSSVAYQHDVSDAQAKFADLAADAYLVSIWATPDPDAGVTLPELVRRLEDRLVDVGEFEKRLLRTGYRHAHTSTYTNQFTVLHASWFPIDRVPRVRGFDPGVTNVRYTMQLDPTQALPVEDVRAILERVFRS